MSRAGDLFWCALSAPLLLPMFLLIALAIWLDDGGPVLFRQERQGRGRRAFTIYKFRTMRDGRVTRVGAWLRRCGLDEAAQWLNVLRGDMSWIGPRPLTGADIARLHWDQPQHDARFSIKPGMTGLAQLLAGKGGGWTRGVDRLYRQRRGMRLNSWVALWSVAVSVLGKRRVRRFLRRRGFGNLERALSISPGQARAASASLGGAVTENPT